MLSDIKDQVEEITDQIKDSVETAVSSTKKTGKRINIYVKKNPWPTTGIALAAGFVTGWILKWRRNSY